MRKTTQLKKLIRDDEILKMPCVYDALSAKIAGNAGFKALCIGGYGVSAALLGKPDISLLSMTEMTDQIGRICDAVELPVLADADTGHGTIPNIIRTVKSFEKAGAAGLFIEDQVFPKRCGHMAGKEIVSRTEMLTKIKAAVDARTDPDFVIMGRTDALAVEGLDEAIERGKWMHEAGADLIFVETPLSTADMKRINAEIEGPTFTVYLEGGKIPLLSAETFQNLGFNVVAYACSGVYAAAYALKNAFREIMATGETKQCRQRMICFDDFNELLGLAQIRLNEKKYAP